MSETATELTIEDRVRKIVADELGFDLEEVTPNANLEHDLNADSLDITELVIRCEEEFGIEIADEDIDRIRTVADVVKIVERTKPTSKPGFVPFEG